MSIVKMKKLAVVGLDTAKEDLISRLMNLEAVQINDVSSKLSDETWAKIGTRDGDDDKAVSLDAYVNRIGIAIETLEAVNTAKKPLFFTRREVGVKEFEHIMERREEIGKNVEYVLGLNDQLHSLQEKINRHNTDLTMLGPWLDYDLPLDLTETRCTDIDLGIVPVTVDFQELHDAVHEENENTIMREINRDREMIYLVIISTKRDVDHGIISFLKQWGYTPMPFEGFKGTAKENKERIEGEIREMEKQCDTLRAEIAKHEDLLPDIQCLQDALVMERDRERLKSSFLKTKRTFCLEGWVPEPVTKQVTKILEDTGCYYEFSDPEEGEEIPVLLRTSSFANPFTAVTEMYALPDYKGFDPTNIFSIFYAFFFGLMLSDAGYGLVLFLVCYFILKKYPLEGTMRKMFRMFEICGLFTIFWGVMFGGYFGDLAEVWASTVFGVTIDIKPLWFDPMEDPTKLLIFSLILGVIHLFVAMGIDMYMKIRDGHVADAILDQVPWYMVVTGAACWLGGSAISPALTTPGKFLFIGGMIIVLLTAGRHAPTIMGKVTGGLSGVYGITGWISDILSYARLLALGLATGVIASVVNLLGSMVGTGVKGAIALIIIGIFGHVFSMAINVLGAFVHTSRLQYVEFFGKFYEDGGEPFRPFIRDTKYVKFDDTK